LRKKILSSSNSSSRFSGGDRASETVGHCRQQRPVLCPDQRSHGGGKTFHARVELAEKKAIDEGVIAEAIRFDDDVPEAPARPSKDVPEERELYGLLVRRALRARRRVSVKGMLSVVSCRLSVMHCLDESTSRRTDTARLMMRRPDGDSAQTTDN
jgi:hypothetical protein